MKTLLFTLFTLFLFPNLQAQNNSSVLNGFKYVTVVMPVYQNNQIDVYGLGSQTVDFFRSKGYKILDQNPQLWPVQVKENPCQAMGVVITNNGASFVKLDMYNCKSEVIFTEKSNSANWVNDHYDNYRRSLKNIFKSIGNQSLRYDARLTPKIEFPEVEKVDEDETSLMEYFRNNSLDDIEGIYNSYQSDQIAHYKIGIKKFGDKYKAILLESKHNHWKVGEIKANFERTSLSNMYATEWFAANKLSSRTFASLEDQSILNIEFKIGNTGEKRIDKFIKLFPSSTIQSESGSDIGSSGLKSSGSGVFISTDGLIATNSHVVSGENGIKIMVSNELGVAEYNAEIVLKDDVNDVAILRIKDELFVPLSKLPYGISERTDVGEDIFTIGYPMSTVMGANSKVTDGIISSNTGIKDDVRYLQLTAPIQPGNSGGPLFNESGNIVGLTTSKLNGDAVNAPIENVNYAIKSVYVLNIINMIPSNNAINNSTSDLSNMSLKEKVRILKNYICLIKVY